MSEDVKPDDAGGVVVSDRARAGLDDFVMHAVKNSMAASGFDCTANPAEDAIPPEREVVMLTVSSYLYRVLLFIHFNRDAATRGYVADLAGTSLSEMDDERFNDVMMERGNLCCGALNRDIATVLPHIGMSTPCILHRSSMEHVSALAPAYTRRFKADVSPAVSLHFTLALCAFANLDFAFEPRTVEEDETAGELEMF